MLHTFIYFRGTSSVPDKATAQPKVPGFGYDYGYAEGTYRN